MRPASAVQILSPASIDPSPPYQGSPMDEFDVFIACPRSDEEDARRLHAVLTAADGRVFRHADGRG